jgi:hypothetical protein
LDIDRQHPNSPTFVPELKGIDPLANFSHELIAWRWAPPRAPAQ